MKERVVKARVRGNKAIDGADVRLVRVLGPETVYDFDPFLMLDAFDSSHPEDYIKGFPTHPHRGIETLTYLVDGAIDHADSLGNKGRITPGGAQWMTAGSGIMHSEMPKESERMLGVQLWINLSQKDKMTTPQYFDIKKEDIPSKVIEGGKVRVIAGHFDGVEGLKPPHEPITMYDISLEASAELIFSAEQKTAFLFLLEGDVLVAGKREEEKTALLLEEGDSISLKATDKPARILFFAGTPLGEEIAWGGPVVMNTDKELKEAFLEMREGSFIKEKPEGRA